MSRFRAHHETHAIRRIGWLRAAVLGANDGIVSTASLIVGMAASGAGAQAVWIAGISGLVAGAMSMAAGEYVSVSAQADTEQAELDKERQELIDSPAHELEELTAIYMKRGLTRELASQVAQQLMEKDALGAHARDELGISEISVARPIQAAFTSAATFAAGAALPLLATFLSPPGYISWTVALASLGFLALLGALGAKVGNAPVLLATLRVTFWGAIAMAITAGIGALAGVGV